MRDALKGVAAVFTVDTSVTAQVRWRFHLNRVALHAKAGWTIVRFVRARQRSVYFSFPGGHSIWYVLPLVFLACLLRYRVVVHHHSFSYLDRRLAAVALLVRVTSDSVVHVCLCPSMASGMRSSYRHASRVLVCSNAAFVGDPVATPVREEPHALGKIVVGHLSNLSAEKGLVDVVELVCAARDAGLLVELRLAGPCASVLAEQTVVSAQADLGERMRWSGPVDARERDEFLAQIDVFVLPTRYVHEAEPLVLLEALSAGVPIVAFGRGCVEHQTSGAGLVVGPGEDFVTAALPYLRRLLNEPTFRSEQRLEALAAAALHRVSASRQADTLIRYLAGELTSSALPNS